MQLDGTELQVIDKRLAHKYSEVKDALTSNQKNAPENMNRKALLKELDIQKRRYPSLTDTTGKNKAKQFNFRKHKTEYSKGSLKERIHHTRQKIDIIMKSIVKNKNKAAGSQKGKSLQYP